MNTTTRAQRINKRYDTIWDFYKQQEAEKIKIQTKAEIKERIEKLEFDENGNAIDRVYAESLYELEEEANHKP